MNEPGRSPDVIAETQSLQEEIERLRAERDAALHQADEYRDLLRQVRADFASHRRQVEEERAEHEIQARVDLLVRVLPVLDDFQKALAAAPQERARPEWAATIEQIERSLREVLAAEGVQKIEAAGALFNPWLHEALQHQASPELDDERILAVLRDGYRMGDRVIRPAQVVVARRTP